MENEHASHGIGAVHETGGSFLYFYRTDVLSVNLYAMFVAPLLTFLPYAVVDDYQPVVAQSADYGFGDAATGRDLRNTWLVGYGIDDVGRGDGQQVFVGNDVDGGCHVAELAVSGQAGNDDLVNL